MLCALCCSRAAESITIEESFKYLATILTPFAYELRHKAAVLQAARNRHSNSLLSVMKLHPEILSEIFLYACFDSADSESTTWLSPNTLPRNYRQLRHDISSVCHYWRRVVVTTSALWSHILIETRNTKAWSFIALELERSAKRSLSFSFLSHSRNPERWDVELPAIRDALPRAKSIYIRDLGEAGIVGDLMGALHPPTRFPHLQFFSAEVDEEALTVIDLSRATTLEFLHLTGRIVLSDVSATFLTHVEVCPVDDDQGLDLGLLANASHLKELNVSFPSTEPSLQHNLPTLQRLTCWFGPEAYTASLVAPNLTHLTMTPWDTSPFTSQFPALESLTLPLFFYDGFALLEGLLGTPTLRRLRLLCGDDELGLRFRDLAERLGQRDESGVFVLLPLLRELIIDESSIEGEAFDDEYAEALLFVRNKGVAEQPVMPFRLTLPSRCTSRDFRTRHPWSVSIPEGDSESNSSDDGLSSSDDGSET